FSQVCLSDGWRDSPNNGRSTRRRSVVRPRSQGPADAAAADELGASTLVPNVPGSVSEPLGRRAGCSQKGQFASDARLALACCQSVRYILNHMVQYERTRLDASFAALSATPRP